MDFLTNIQTTAISFITFFGNIIQPIVEGGGDGELPPVGLWEQLMQFLKFMANIELAWMNMIYWLICVILVFLPLNLVAVLVGVFDWITVNMTQLVLFGNTDTFNINSIPVQFWFFLIAAILLGVGIFVFHFLSHGFQGELNTKTKVVESLKSSGIAMLFMFAIPLGMYLLILLMSIGRQAVTFMFNTNMDEGGNSIGNLLYKIGFASWDDSIDKVPPGYIPKFPMDFKILNYNIFVGFGAVILMGYALGLLCVAVIGRALEMFALFIVSPLIAATMVNDNGVVFKQWRTQVMNKAFAQIATVIILNIGLLFLFSLTSSISQIGASWEGALLQVTLLLTIFAVSNFMTSGVQLLAGYIGGEAMAAEEGKSMGNIKKSMGTLFQAGKVGAAIATGVGTAAVLGKMALKNKMGGGSFKELGKNALFKEKTKKMRSNLLGKKYKGEKGGIPNLPGAGDGGITDEVTRGSSNAKKAGMIAGGVFAPVTAAAAAVFGGTKLGKHISTKRKLNGGGKKGEFGITSEKNDAGELIFTSKTKIDGMKKDDYDGKNKKHIKIAQKQNALIDARDAQAAKAKKLTDKAAENVLKKAAAEELGKEKKSYNEKLENDKKIRKETAKNKKAEK